ncbi:hypothetical protein CEXT_487091 [Caerostris extrusa]|uniref:Uncharacterized protein n=1 Tax=Caerostris extrusa TaxID=172846 RepID=A0AAV4MFL9_CAEEX|nr:hypothetical protein CEXT_487091 [Caerostris extrusa]
MAIITRNSEAACLAERERGKKTFREYLFFLFCVLSFSPGSSQRLLRHSKKKRNLSNWSSFWRHATAPATLVVSVRSDLVVHSARVPNVDWLLSNLVFVHYTSSISTISL